MTEDTSRRQEARQVWKEMIQQHPPRVRFDFSVRGVPNADQAILDHFEFMMSIMELHPIIPFEECSFGSDVLDDRRSLAYHIIQRQLGHSRSLVVNANIANRVGVGNSLRAMLEMYAFAKFFRDEGGINNHKLIDIFLHGQSFATGGWHEIEKVWRDKYGERLPEDAKEFMQALFGLPRVNKILKPAHEDDEGFSYLYSRYSEFVHPAFCRPRDDFEEALGLKNPDPRGSSAYFRGEVRNGAPPSLILRDISAAVFCLEMFWPVAFDIDPHFDKKLRPQIVKILLEHGFDKR